MTDVTEKNKIIITRKDWMERAHGGILILESWLKKWLEDDPAKRENIDHYIDLSKGISADLQRAKNEEK